MSIEPKKTALLTLDLQHGILARVPGAAALRELAAQAVEEARKKNYRIIHVGLGFENGYPEAPVNGGPFAQVKSSGLFLKGSESAGIWPELLRKDDLIIYKQRYSAFTENTLHLVLRSQCIENLVMFGVSTSGIVLSTLRRAFDLDFNCTIIKDACYDKDPEVHRVLTEKVLPMQANVISLADFQSL
jgi:nicotinamidase-related amidase